LVADADEQNFVKCRQAMVMIIAGYASFSAEQIG
jgi:hypothetical protein